MPDGTLFIAGPGTGNGAVLGAFGGPVFGREGDTPELRTWRGKLETDFGFVAADGAEKNDVALLFFRCALVLKLNFGAASEAGLNQDESAVGVDGEGLGFFFEFGALRVHSGQLDGHLHEHALAAAARAGVGRQDRRLRHSSSLAKSFKS
jgi:hypothetical protein